MQRALGCLIVVLSMGSASAGSRTRPCVLRPGSAGGITTGTAMTVQALAKAVRATWEIQQHSLGEDVFVNYATAPELPGLPASAYVGKPVTDVTITSARCATERGLAVGDTLATARKAYPDLRCRSHTANKQQGRPASIECTSAAMSGRLTVDPAGVRTSGKLDVAANADRSIVAIVWSL